MSEGTMPAAGGIGRVALFLARDIGGVARMRLHLAGALLRRGYRVDILVPRLRRGLDHIPEGARAVELTRWLPARRQLLPTHYVAIPALACYLRREQPHVLLSATTPLNIAAVLARRISYTDVRLVISQHNPVSETIASRQYRSSRIMAPLVRKFYPAADAIVAVSHGIAHDLRNNIKLKYNNIKVIHNPAVTDGIYELMYIQPEHRWFKTKKYPIILAVGRLTMQKAFDDLVRAFSLLRSRYDAKLLILGSGPEEARLRKLVCEHNLEQHIDLPGKVDNPYAYMARADLFVLSSRYEGFGNVLVEALACGCPVVATDCPGGPTDILEGGRWGRLVPVGDTEAMAGAMRATLDDPPDPAPLRRRAMDFHVDRIVERYQEVLRV